ncbi:uroporphyrinogen-III synthase [soil metagenome]
MVLGPLSGFTVGVTADRRHEEQAELLQRRGARVVHGPTIRTLALADDPALAAATERVIASPPDIVVLTTGLGTRGWLSAAESNGRDEDLLVALGGARVVARGPKAVGAAAALGLPVHWSAPTEQGREIVEHLLAGGVEGTRIAVQRDGGPEAVIADALLAAGAEVVDVPVYRWTLPNDPAPAHRLVVAAAEGRLDAVTFTSSPALRHFVDLAGGLGRGADILAAFRGPVAAVCVGPVCAGTAEALGIAAPVQPRRGRLGAMVQALVRHLDGRSLAVELAGVRCVLQGSSFCLDGHVVALSDRERALLEALASRPGQVVTKEALMARGWRGATTDPHAVEVAVGRLRRRLGTAGRGIETIPRRGYRLAVSAG